MLLRTCLSNYAILFLLCAKLILQILVPQQRIGTLLLQYPQEFLLCCRNHTRGFHLGSLKTLPGCGLSGRNNISSFAANRFSHLPGFSNGCIRSRIGG